MPNWKDLLDEVKKAGSTYDLVRRQYMAKLAEKTGRNVIAYYSGWLQKTDLTSRGVGGFELNDNDKNGFMAAIHGLDRKKGLDLILHTPGGEIAATESLVDYLHSMFDDIRAVVPQIAMSAGTMVALGCNTILMGKHSSLGPIDPQINGIPAHGIVEEFVEAAKEIRANPATVPLWQPIIAKYHPTLIGECKKAIEWSSEIVRAWLIARMFAGDPATAGAKADRVIEELGSHALTKSHARHISMKKARELGLNVVGLEDDDGIQEAVLTVHHACIQTLAATNVIKLIENHRGVTFVQAFELRALPQ
jgi:hypothetical protein